MSNSEMDLTPKKLDLKFQRGSTVTFPVTYADDADVPIDLSAFSAVFKVVPRAGGDAVLEFSDSDLTGSRLTKNDEEGEIIVFIDEDDTAIFPDGDFIYALALVKEDDTRYLLAGSFKASGTAVI